MIRAVGSIRDIEAVEAELKRRRNYTIVPFAYELRHDGGREPGGQLPEGYKSAVYTRAYEVYPDTRISGRPEDWKGLRDGLRWWFSEEILIRFVYSCRDGHGKVVLAREALNDISKNMPQLAGMIKALPAENTAAARNYTGERYAKLDFGCGQGGFAELTADRLGRASWLAVNGGPDSVGVDINQGYIERAQERIKNGTIFAVQDGRNLNYPNQEFDTIHVNGVLHHIADYELAVSEIARVHRPGGKLLLCESVDNDPMFRAARRLAGSFQGVPILSLFKTDELEAELGRYYNIQARRYYWRFLLSDALLAIRMEPAPSLWFNRLVNKYLERHGWDKAACSHFIVEAERKT